MKRKLELALDTYGRWFWYPLTDVFAAVTGLRRLQDHLEARQRARREANLWNLVVTLEGAGLSESAGRLADHLARRQPES